MPYREDREADVARADALQVDVERAERELAAARAKLAETERSRDALAAELARRPAAKPAPEPVPTSRPSARPVAVLVAVVFLLGGLGWYVTVSRSRQRDAAARELDSARQRLNAQLAAGPCTLHTIPEGASVYRTVGGEEVLLGETPMVLSMPPTASSPSLVVRAVGYTQHELSLWNGCPPALHLDR